MVTVDAFLDWLKTSHYTGPVTYGLQATVWSVESADVERWIGDCERNPHGIQRLLDQGSCSHCKEAAAYLKYLEQAAKMYSAEY